MNEAETAKLLRKPTLSVGQASALLGLSQNATYEAIKRHEIEVLRFGKRILVLTAPLRRMLGITQDEAA